ncbi:rod shape-determining protein MreD [Prolixibacter sp. SD074]|jgi:rod shape-determining protein MreD|uniref:rod shape-determining protein MreD n=1 Tax=Prolixibacter sp. SD074 TaxID=2652391 RepID=UPI0012757E63|nr:rod shape-determining protein MreD [Prolixibacter sp. SD074]GET30029.1 rod shape-determining protein MreD [Prolixibacter sp. SD074]
MINDILKYGIMYVVLVLVQVLLINNVQLGGMYSPFIYILFILLLPFDTPRYLLLILGFLLGLTIDIFSNTPGIHASATVFAAFLRPGVLMLVSSRDNHEPGSAPRISTYGFEWFLKYAVILILAHNLFLFFAEAFTLHGLFHTLLKAIINSFLSIILIVLSQYLVFRK